MAKRITLAQQKRMVRDILGKSMKLYLNKGQLRDKSHVVSTADMAAMEKLCAKWMKRIG
mgnify:CR=1 FL=1